MKEKNADKGELLLLLLLVVFTVLFRHQVLASMTQRPKEYAFM
jgi:hypothetical protein